jgi:HPt (histidine-containing phosphotransfer) domain-containing protein
MDDHLSKPFSMARLQETLDRWIPAKPAPTPSAAELAAEATARAAEVVDRQVLDRLASVLERPLLARVLNLYLEELPNLLGRLKEAVRGGETSGVTTAAHALKSCSQNIGARALGRYCSDVDASMRRGDRKEAERILANIEAEHACLQAALSAELAGVDANTN